MISGFDYGTSNCAIGVVEALNHTNTLSSHSVKSRLIPLEGDNIFLPSTVYAFGRDLISDYVVSNLSPLSSMPDYLETRQFSLAQAARFKREESIAADEQVLFFGRDAFSQYYELPGEGYFVKSVKSFLGAGGVRPEFIRFFEDIVTATMIHIKNAAQTTLQTDLTHTVIGKPVNFQGSHSEHSNQQALDILSISAKRAGFQNVEFLYEPIAAGLDFEIGLSENKKVLVVDIGGGTSDCAMVLMGPNYVNKTDRYTDFLGHAGERVGGNDFDIQVAARNLMPLFGMNSMLKNGLPMPNQSYWDAMSTNDVGAQADFYALKTTLLLEQLHRDSQQPQLLSRFLKMRDQKQNQHIVKIAEEAKINLSTNINTEIGLGFIEEQLEAELSISQLKSSIQRPLQKIIKLMRETISQAGAQPDLIYITGGTAKSPVIKQTINEHIGDIPIVDGDHFGSVANGLTLWADRIYK